MSAFIDIDRRYHTLYGYRAGLLPTERTRLHPWHSMLAKAVKARRAKRLHPSVAAMAALIESDGIVRMYADEMISQQALLRDPHGHPIPPSSVIKDIPDMLAKLDHIVTYAPWFSDPSHFPMSALFVYVMMTPAGESLFRNAAFNDSLRGVLREWCSYLDSKESLHVVTPGAEKGAVGWLSPQAYGGGKNGMKLWDFRIPEYKDKKHWGFRSYNDYFHREILEVVTADQVPPAYLGAQRKIWAKNTEVGAVPRPLAAPDDPRVIVSANDGQVWKIAENIEAMDRFWLKGQPYSLVNMLDNHHVERFVGGTVFQSFLSGANYHRWHAPIAGTVRLAKKVEGLMFSDAESAGWDDGAAILSQGYEASVNTRGLVFIESPLRSIGMVCVIPIGITEISSITITAEEGQRVDKGDELGFFSYGGSTLALVFQPGAIAETTKKVGDMIDVNAQIATAR
jgi:phosphatidylserine decarboxylase